MNAAALESFEGSHGAMCLWLDLGKNPAPRPDPLDADQLAEIDANPLHERKWGFSR